MDEASLLGLSMQPWQPNLARIIPVTFSAKGNSCDTEVQISPQSLYSLALH